MEVDTAESGEEGTEHHHRKNGIHNIAQNIACSIELRHEIEQQIYHCSYGYRYRKSPIFDKLLQFHAAKVQKSFVIKKFFVTLQPI